MDRTISAAGDAARVSRGCACETGLTLESVPECTLTRVKASQPRLRIGELARRSGVSPDTLRHYERLQLLPKAARTGGGFREYPDGVERRVKVIQQALAIGFSLDELKEFFRERAAGRHPCRRVRRLAQAKFDALEQQLEAILAARRALSAILENWDRRLEQHQGDPANLLDSLAELEPLQLSEMRRLPQRRRARSSQ